MMPATNWDFFIATVEFALKNPALGPAFGEYLQNRIRPSAATRRSAMAASTRRERSHEQVMTAALIRRRFRPHAGRS